MSPMDDPTLVKNLTRQGMTTDEACAFHNVKAQIHALAEVIGDSNNEETELFAVVKEEERV